MKLLICTQAVDSKDPVLGFFVRWIEEFSKQCDQVTVICLRKGHDHLPGNVQVVLLSRAGRVRRALQLLRISVKRRKSYDTVFVHMNPEYVIVAGLPWRLMRKRISLWYTHSKVDAKLRVAAALVQDIFTASAESFRLPTGKVHIMGHGIDVDFFSPDPSVVRESTVLSAGRLSVAKRHDLVVRAAEHFSNEVRIIGAGPEQTSLEKLIAKLGLTSQVRLMGSRTQEGLLEEYRRAHVLLHVSETGSLDKVVLEALACDLPVVTTSTILNDLPVTVVSATPEAIAEAVKGRSWKSEHSLSSYVREHHSLRRLIPAIVVVMSKS